MICLFYRFNPVETGKRPENFRNNDGAVSLLIVFQNGDSHPVSYRSSADRMNKILIAVFIFKPDIQAARLKIRAVGT